MSNTTPIPRRNRKGLIPKDMRPTFPFLPVAVGVWLVSIAYGLIDPRGEFAKERVEIEPKKENGGLENLRFVLGLNNL